MWACGTSIICYLIYLLCASNNDLKLCNSPCFESSFQHFQMCGVDSNHSFKCLACTSPKHLPNLHSLQVHFASEHGVVNLLSSPATQAVVPLCTFSCHATSCKPQEYYASCLFCGATALTEEEMRLHLGSRHGVFFQHNWKQYCSHHCRWTSLNLSDSIWYSNV